MSATGSRNDPYLAFRFEVSIDDMAHAGFSECTGLSLETEFEDYQEGGANQFVHKFPTRTRQSNLTLKRGIVDRELWDWYYGLTQGAVRTRNVDVIVRDEAGAAAVMRWCCKDALPVKWQGSDLNATQSNVAVETLELCFASLERRV